MWVKPLVVFILAVVCLSSEMVYGSIVVPFSVPQFSIRGVSSHLDETLVGLQWPRGNRRVRRYHPQCDIAAKSGICLNEGKNVIVPNVSPGGIIASYSFEESVSGVLFDTSGNGNHGIAHLSGAPQPAAGSVDTPANSPSIATTTGRNLDKAGVFDGKHYYQVVASDSLKSIEYTKSVSTNLWFYLANNIVTSSIAAGCPFFQFGIYTLFLTPDNYIGVSIVDKNVAISYSKLTVEKWTNIAVSFNKKERLFELYINSVPDVTVELDNLGIYQYTNMYVGSIPDTPCQGASYYIDDVTVRNGALTPSLIAASSFTALGSNEAAFTHLACSRNTKCNFFQAQSTCMNGYHLCSQRELATGAYTIARLQGWLKYNDELWTADDQDKFTLTYQTTNKVEIQSDKLFDSKNVDTFDVEDVVFGENSRKSKHQRELAKAIRIEAEQMNVPKMALCCAVQA